MKTNIFNRPWRASQPASSGLSATGAALTAALLLLATANLRAGVPNGVVVGSLCGGGASPFYGYVEGNPANSTDAKFHTPIGLAQDSTGEYLFVADRDNNAIRVVDLSSSSTHYNFTYTFAPIPGFTSGTIAKPVGVALDADDNVYVLNCGNGKNGRVVMFDDYGDPLATNAVALINANAITLDNAGNVYVTASNLLLRITFPSGSTTTNFTVANAGANLQGLVVMDSGMIAACDSGLNGNGGIRLIDPNAHTNSILTGFNGAGDNTNIWDNTPNHPVTKATAMFNQPTGLAKAGNGMLVVADYGNNRVKVVNSAGAVTNLYGVSSNLWYTGSGSYPGWRDGNVTVPDALGDVEARLPNGVLLASDSAGAVTVYVTEDYYHLIRKVTGANLPVPAPKPPPSLAALASCGQVSLTWSASPGAANYNVKRSTINGGPYTNDTVASTSVTSYNDTNVLSGTTYYYVVSAVGAGGEGANSGQVSATLPLPPALTIFTVITSYGQVALTWSAVSCSSVAYTYNVERATSSGGPYAVLANTSATSYTDTNVLDGTTYYYVVSALSDGGQGPNSAQVSATPPLPPAPTILTVATNCAQASLTWSVVVCPSITYNVKRSSSSGGPYTTIANTTSTAFTDTSVLSGTTNYYVVSALSDGGEGSNSAQVVVWVPHCQVPAPVIGYVGFPANSMPIPYTSVLYPMSSFVANNDLPIVIEGTNGSQTFYSYGPTSGSIPNPTSASASAPVGYQDGMSPSQVAYYTVQIQPDGCYGDLTIKAIGEKSDGSPNSAIVQARFQFVTANPTVTGNNAAQFTVSDLTTNAQMWYTTDGSTPTNAAPSVGPIPSGTTLSLQFPAGGSNLTFKVIAFRACYQPSAIVTVIFSATNFVPNSISFGFASGEASSQFIGSPGQTFYAPVTLSVLPNTMMYSLQFNLTVTTNGLPNAGPAVTPGTYGFQSMLMKPIVPIPTNYPPGFALYTNIPPNMEAIDTNFYLLGVGWLERYGETNLYDTLSQDLIQYSMAHDDLFPNAQQPNGVIVGGYGFQIPGGAKPGQQYQIQIGLPSATDDGIGAPGSDVYIATPTTGSLSNGAMNSIKIVTAGQRKYYAGDCYPFRWFNAGDFGDTNLDNADVMQVFQSAIYSLNYPPPGSDFRDSMDSSGGLGMPDPSTGYYTNAGLLTLAQQIALFNANYTNINQMVFGNGVLDVCDVYVTFCRSLDTNLYRFQRFWTNGVLGAQVVDPQHNVQVLAKSLDTAVQSQVSMSFLTNPPSVNFAAADFTNASAGKTVQIPITARIFGDYPLRVLMLNLSVEPLDGSPALTSPIQFTPNPALGTNAMSYSTGNANYAATWLDSTITGLTGTANLGTLTVTVPANAASSAAYAIHFDHASASPNGIASFPKHALTGLITLSSRTSSSYNDGIADSWRLRWFGTIYNVLSTANADACGDGINNWDKYVAGTDPTDPTAYPRLNSRTPAPAGSAIAMHWPSVSGKQYVIERSTSLFTGSWSAIATNTGTGADMEFDDQHSGNASFYRVRILP